jgi:hypothetical protein
MSLQRLKRALVVSAAVIALAGCFYRKGPDELHYLGGDGPDYYKDVATQIEYPTTEEERPAQVTTSTEPHTIFSRQKDQIWDMTLAQALELALANNKIIRSAGSFGAPGNALMTNPNGVESVYDPAIQETGVLFGGRGVEAALSDFDAQLAVSNTFVPVPVACSSSTPTPSTPPCQRHLPTAARFSFRISGTISTSTRRACCSHRRTPVSRKCLTRSLCGPGQAPNSRESPAWSTTSLQRSPA